MLCDLHVHTNRSGMCTVPMLRRFCRESYSEPDAVYEALKGRGMDLVTITDHDSIGALETLRRHNDFFLSEEASCVTPSGTRLHLGVYDIQERHHIEIQRRRTDLVSLVAFLNEQRLFFTINHVFSGLTGPRAESDFEFFQEHFPGVETRNGHMLEFSNRLSLDFAERFRKAPVGGSDAHTLTTVARTYTEIRGARNKQEFLEGLRQGRGSVQGESGNYWKLTRTIFEIGCQMVRERASTLWLAPLVLAVPAFTFFNYLREVSFACKWGRRLRRRRELGIEAKFA
jgi:predicted metal-dependent phosphoesterase TrpH